MAEMAGMVQVYDFLAGSGLGADGTPIKPTKEQKAEFPLAQFRAEWAELTDQDKLDLRTGIGNGSLTY